MTTNLVDQDYWDGGYAQAEFSPLAPDHFLRAWINAHVPRGKGDCLEIGCFPGRFLAAFGDLGYRLHGVDLTPRVEAVPAWLASRGYAVGAFHRADFLTCPLAQRYDVVSSFGFIEHFTNWQEILGRHADLVAPGGFLVIEAPNMAGLVQRSLRRLFDPEDLERHHTPAMHVDAWATIATRLGFEVLHAGPLGTFDIWGTTSGEREGFKFELAVLLDIIKPVLQLREETQGPASAAYLGLIARRIADGPPPGDPERARDLATIAETVAARDRDVGRAAQAIVDRVNAWVQHMSLKWTLRT